MLNILLMTGMCLSTIISLLGLFWDIKKQERKHRISHLLLLAIPFLMVLFTIFMPASITSRINLGLSMLNSGEYLHAQNVFEELDNQEMVLESQYAYAKQLYRAENWDAAIEIFSELNDYKDSKQYLERAEMLKSMSISSTIIGDEFLAEQEKMYSLACQYYNAGQFIQALDYFKILDGYKDSNQMLEESRISARKAASHTISAGIRLVLAIKNDETILSAGDSRYFDFTQWKDIVSISNLGGIAIGLKDDGTVVSTGSYSVDLGNWSDIISISAGERYVIGLKSDGTVVGAGHDMGDGQLQISGWSSIVAIATGWRHTVGLDSDGCVHITGYRSSAQLAEIEKNQSEWSDIIAIAAGGGGSVGTGHTVGLRADGTVVAVGDNSLGQCNVSDWTNIVAIAAGDWHTVGLRSDGTVVSTRPNSSIYSAACNVEGWSDIIEIAAGCGYTMGLHSDGTVVSLGYNDYNQLDGTANWENIKPTSR